MSNTNPTKNLGVNSGAREVPTSYKTPAYFAYNRTIGM